MKILKGILICITIAAFSVSLLEVVLGETINAIILTLVGTLDSVVLALFDKIVYNEEIE